MSLTVCTFIRDPATGDAHLNAALDAPDRDLAGVEAWRKSVWGSDYAVRAGAAFLPRLREGDLYVEHADVNAFAQECAQLFEDVESFAAAVGISREALAIRLDNLRTAAANAKLSGCGVYMG